jgi:GDPmannose 4,6-dehydratase
VRVSFDIPEYTFDVTGGGTLRLLEAIREAEVKTRFYQASSSEMFGAAPPPQSETTQFHPRSPYAVSKVAAYWATVNYREAYDMFACNGVLFNHESPRRGETFASRKITRAVGRIRHGLQDRLYLGNLAARRDWGYAKDYVEAMWRMLQGETPEDYVVATGKSHTVREFCERAFARAGWELEWRGEGTAEKGIDRGTGRVLVEIDPAYFRPTEVEHLLGDATRARERLGWAPTVDFDALVALMTDADVQLAARELAAREAGGQGRGALPGGVA